MKLAPLSPLPLIVLLCVTWNSAPAADNPRPLIGTWSGRATGPQGGPPTGDLTVTLEAASGRMVKGTIAVSGQGGMEYSGTITEGKLDKGVFSATVVFKLGENPLEILVTGPLKGKKIAGTFTVSAKGQKMGDGTFAISKLAPVKKKPAGTAN